MNQGVDSAIGLIGGMNGGIAAVLVSQPLDTVKVKTQTFPELYRSATRCFVDTLFKEGLFRGLYAGTLPSLIASAAENAITFAILPLCQNFVASMSGISDTKALSLPQHGLAGFFAGIGSALVLCPTELVKCKSQAFNEMALLDPKKAFPTGPTSITKHVLRTEGFRGLYRGFLPTLARETFGLCVFFGSYEFFRDLMTPSGSDKEDLGHLATAVAGGLSGMAIWTSIFPFDVVKSRMQIGHLSPKSPSYHSTNFLKVLRLIYNTEGFRALYTGLAPTLLRTVPSCAALFVAVEWTRKIGHRLIGQKN
nr:mitochondrial carnitine:acylcarnitine carrier [Hymenolepis microstoma]